MDQNSRNSVYVSMMVDALKRKKKILGSLLQYTKDQEQLLKNDELDYDAFNEIIELKGRLIDELNDIDDGFDALFKMVEKEISGNRMSYKSEIQQMQQLIGEVSEFGIQIQALEQQNSGHFKIYLANQRKTIREFHVNNRSATNYYKNMASTPQAEQSYLFDETK